MSTNTQKKAISNINSTPNIEINKPVLSAYSSILRKHRKTNEQRKSVKTQNIPLKNRFYKIN